MDENKTSDAPQQAEKPDESRFGLEYGVESNMPFATPYRPAQDGTKKNLDEELREIGREEMEDWGPTVRQLIAMRRMDGQATALYRLLTLPILSALSKATFVPAEGGEAEAEFIDQVMHTPPESGGMTVTFHRFMRQMLMGLFDGFSSFEKVFWMPEHGPLQGKITLKKIGYRDPATITFITDDRGGFKGLRQRVYQGGRVVDVYIPREYAFYYAANEEQRKFYGVSFFQSAFYHYDKKVKLYFTAHVAAQRAAVGTRAGTHPQSATESQKRDFAAALNNMSVAQWMMMPDNFKVEILKEGGSFDFLAQINHHNSAMSKSLLAGFLDSESGGSTGEKTPLIQNNQPGDEMFKLMLGAIMDEIANQINHYIIPQLIDFNFDGGKYPTFTWGKLTDDQKAGIATTFDKLASQQTVTPEFIRALEEHQANEFGLEIDYDEIEAREEEEAAAMQAAGVQIDPETGMPVPGAAAVGPDGQPVAAAPGAPGAPAVASAAAGADPDISQFEKQALGLSFEEEDELESQRALLKLTSEMVEAAYNALD